MENGIPTIERGSCLTIFLAGGLFLLLSLVATIITGGMFLYFLFLIGLVAAFIVLNYCLWGWLMPTGSPEPDVVADPDCRDATPRRSEAIQLAADDPRRSRHA